MNKTDTKNGKYQDAIRLKYNGESYPVISKKISTPVSTVEKWFAFNGLLREQYDEYRDKQNALLSDLCDETLAKNVHIASNMLVALMGSSEDGVKFRAVKEILDRVRGAPKGNNDQQGLLGTDLSYEQILKKARAQPP